LSQCGDELYRYILTGSKIFHFLLIIEMTFLIITLLDYGPISFSIVIKNDD